MPAVTLVSYVDSGFAVLHGMTISLSSTQASLT